MGRLPPDIERAAIAWYNSLPADTRGRMLASPLVCADPTPYRCWLVFGPAPGADLREAPAERKSAHKRGRAVGPASRSGL